ncbi:unnamed protein product [Penicillium camemberti]|uniref:Str. FM013 n=1 Tax=Penicillium camemberti (strain FM 013) TaxID=1429867 RepID=A0A0G4NWC5_PENC3|nr:unnamed protein product [Penicillium camemberti]
MVAGLPRALSLTRVVEFANDLEKKTTEEITVTFAVGPVREESIEYIGAA